MQDKSKGNLKNQEETTKDQKLDKIFWFKVIISIIFGILFGILRLTGLFSFLIFVILCIVLTSLYFSKFITNEEIDYQSEVFTEGMIVSIPLFLLCWIMTYTFSQLMQGANQKVDI